MHYRNNSKGGGQRQKSYPYSIKGMGGGPGRNREVRGNNRGRDDVNAVEELVYTHEELVTRILQVQNVMTSCWDCLTPCFSQEKEDLILAHRRQIDEMMEVVKQEMKLLHTVDQVRNCSWEEHGSS